MAKIDNITNPTIVGRLVPPEEVHLENLAMDEFCLRVIAEWLWDLFEHESLPVDEAHDITDLVQTFNVQDEALFRETIEHLPIEYAVNDGDKVRFVKSAPVGLALDYLLNEAPKDFGRCFSYFAKQLQVGLDRTLLGVEGVPISAEDWNKILGSPWYENERRRSFEFAKLADFGRSKDEPLRVLDFGCGSGFSGQQLQGYFEAHGVEYELYGYDPAPTAMLLAKQRVPGLKPYNFQQPEDKIDFDAVFVCHVLHWIPVAHQAPTITLINRILRSPGKLFGVGLFAPPDYNHVIGTMCKTMRGGLIPSPAVFESWFEGTGLKLRVDIRNRVFCADK